MPRLTLHEIEEHLEGEEELYGLPAGDKKQSLSEERYRALRADKNTDWMKVAKFYDLSPYAEWCEADGLLFFEDQHDYPGFYEGWGIGAMYSTEEYLEDDLASTEAMRNEESHYDWFMDDPDLGYRSDEGLLEDTWRDDLVAVENEPRQPPKYPEGKTLGALLQEYGHRFMNVLRKD